MTAAMSRKWMSRESGVMAAMGVVTYQIESPTGEAGAIAVLGLSGRPEDLARVLGGSVKAGAVRRRQVVGVDDGIVVAWSDTYWQVFVHGGKAVLTAVLRELETRGVAGAREDAGDATFPEARTREETQMLRALAAAESPLAVDVLLHHLARMETGEKRRVGAETARALGRLVKPPLVVALGPSNIGKSTLVNALAGRAVALVADEAGTTRDYVGVKLDLGGLVVRYVDAPGVREVPDEIERRAINTAIELAATADLLLWCGDPIKGVLDDQVWERAGRRQRCLVWLRSDLTGLNPPGQALRVCALSGEGVMELAGAIRERLVPAAAGADPGVWNPGNEPPGAAPVYAAGAGSF